MRSRHGPLGHSPTVILASASREALSLGAAHSLAAPTGPEPGRGLRERPRLMENACLLPQPLLHASQVWTCAPHRYRTLGHFHHPGKKPRAHQQSPQVLPTPSPGGPLIQIPSLDSLVPDVSRKGKQTTCGKTSSSFTHVERVRGLCSLRLASIHVTPHLPTTRIQRVSAFDCHKQSCSEHPYTRHVFTPSGRNCWVPVLIFPRHRQASVHTGHASRIPASSV